MKIPTDAQVISRAKEVLAIEADAILQARERLNSNRDFAELVRSVLALRSGARVVVTGMGKSGHIARKIAATLASTGTPAIFVHPAEAGHGDLGMITDQDVMLAISQSGQSDEIIRLIPYLKRHRIRLVAMTAGKDSPLALHADLVVDTSVAREACPLGLAPTASTTLTLALGDALAMCLVEARGFTSDMFAVTHPHGSLGRRLLVSVADVMVKGSNVPVCPETFTVREALIPMSEGGLGFVILVDKAGEAAGVFTDGDLRRTIDLDLDVRRELIGNIARKEFISVCSAQLGAEAVEIMEKHKVSGLPVLDSNTGRLCGALNMRLLLQAGVI